MFFVFFSLSHSLFLPVSTAGRSRFIVVLPRLPPPPVRHLPSALTLPPLTASPRTDREGGRVRDLLSEPVFDSEIWWPGTCLLRLFFCPESSVLTSSRLHVLTSSCPDCVRQRERGVLKRKRQRPVRSGTCIKKKEQKQKQPLLITTPISITITIPVQVRFQFPPLPTPSSPVYKATDPSRRVDAGL